MNYKLIGDNNYISKNIFEEILKNRGINDTYKFLMADKNCLPNPFDFRNMKEAIECLLKHINNEGNIAVIMDSDPDGLTSTSIIYQYINKIGGNITKLIVHKTRVHGIFLHELKGKLKDIDLLIVPDAGSENYKIHKILKNRFDIDIIVLDHHDVQYYSKNAIVVNNQLNKIATDLSGAGMTYLFCKALDQTLNKSYADEYLDLVALGLISDMMDIKSLEVQSLIKEGLSNIKNKAFKALVDKQAFSTKGKINPMTISFYITPLINSIFRLGEYEDRINLCKSFCQIGDSYEDIAKKCSSLNGKRKRMGDKILKNIDIDENNKIICVEIDKEYGQNGMCRIVSNSLSRQYQRPTITYYRNKDGKFKGSMASNIDGFMDMLNGTKLFEFVSGHQKAAGLEIKKDKIEILQSELNEVFKDYEFENIENVDFIIPYNYFTMFGTDIIETICNYDKYYGKGIEEPKIIITDIDVPVKNIELMGKAKNTIKIKVDNITFIKFKEDEDSYNNIISDCTNIKLDIMGKCSINEYNGNKYPQIIVDDFEVKNKANINDDIMKLF